MDKDKWAKARMAFFKRVEGGIAWEDFKRRLDQFTVDSESEPRKVVGGWVVEDIQDQAQNLDVDITEAEALEILDTIERRWDATIGINWVFVDKYISEFVNKRNNRG